jgi:hypothetical protein
MIFGLLISFLAWINGLLIPGSSFGTVASLLIIASFLLLYTGAHCIGMADQPHSKRNPFTRRK